MKESVLIVRPERVPRVRELLLCDEEFRKIVKGDIEVLYYENISVAFVFNRDRYSRALPLNRAVLSKDHKEWYYLYGPFIVVGLDDNHNYTGLTEPQLRYFKNRFYVPAKEIEVDGRKQVVFNLMIR